MEDNPINIDLPNVQVPPSKELFDNYLQVRARLAAEEQERERRSASLLAKEESERIVERLRGASSQGLYSITHRMYDVGFSADAVYAALAAIKKLFENAGYDVSITGRQYTISFFKDEVR